MHCSFLGIPLSYFLLGCIFFRYTSEIPLDLPFAFRQSESRTPIVLLYSGEANMVEKLVIEAAQKKQVGKQLDCCCLPINFDSFKAKNVLELDCVHCHKAVRLPARTHHESVFFSCKCKISPCRYGELKLCFKNRYLGRLLHVAA